MGAILNRSVDAGDDLPIHLTYKSGTPPSPVDLTGYSATCTFRWLGQLYSPAITLGAGGLITGNVPADTTKLWPVGKSVSYQIRLVEPSGRKRTLIDGVVTVSASAIEGVS